MLQLSKLTNEEFAGIIRLAKAANDTEKRYFFENESETQHFAQRLQRYSLLASEAVRRLNQCRGAGETIAAAMADLTDPAQHDHLTALLSLLIELERRREDLELLEYHLEIAAEFMQGVAAHCGTPSDNASEPTDNRTAHDHLATLFADLETLEHDKEMATDFVNSELAAELMQGTPSDTDTDTENDTDRLLALLSDIESALGQITAPYFSADPIDDTDTDSDTDTDTNNDNGNE